MSAEVRILCTLPIERAEEAIAKGEAVWFGVFPDGLAGMLANAKRPRMWAVGTLPEPTTEEAREFCEKHGLTRYLEAGLDQRMIVLGAAANLQRDPSDIVSEMTGLARLPDGRSLGRKLAADDKFDPRMMLVAFVPLDAMELTDGEKAEIRGRSL